VLGDFEGNYNLISKHIERAKASYCDIIAFPELCITGYPPEDLVLNPSFISKNLIYIEKIKKLSDDIVLIIGFVNKDQEIFNSAAVLYGKKTISIYNKQHLPNYSVFDEERYFQKGSGNRIYDLNGFLFGVNICEDIYYSAGPIKEQAILGGAKLIINISASPYHIGKIAEREKILFTRAIDNRVVIAYINTIGGQDELVFDGSSTIIDEKGNSIAKAQSFKEDFIIYDIDQDEITSTRLKDAKYKNQRDKLLKSSEPIDIVKIDKPSRQDSETNTLGDNTIKKAYTPITCVEEELFSALVLGTRDYVIKNNFNKVVLGLSGGIDSALTAVIARFAVGAANVTGVLMPSEYSSSSSISDSLELVKNLGIDHLEIPIKDIYSSYLKNLDKIFRSSDINITKENIQARIRGNILMALSNENGWLVLSTGNKSEISVGYCTLYGDMVGGFSPIKDVYKTMAYRICDFINKKYNNIVPKNIILKPPSAELKPDQKDQDSLPPYDLLDAVLKAYIEDDKDSDTIVKMGFERNTVTEIINMVSNNEYKRRQGSPGVKITQRAFGRDRRYPITNKFRIK